jgi:hypothetical protein
MARHELGGRPRSLRAVSAAVDSAVTCRSNADFCAKGVPIAEYFVVRHLGSSATTGCGSACSVHGGRSVLAVSVFGDWLRGQLRYGWTNAAIATPVQFALDM